MVSSHSIFVIFIMLLYSCLLLKIIKERPGEKKTIPILFKISAVILSFLGVFLVFHFNVLFDMNVEEEVEKIDKEFMIFFSIFSLSIYAFLKRKDHVG